PLSEEFGLARREIELGASIESALANMVKRLGSADLRLLVMVITIQHSVGGDLPAILTTLGDTMRQRSEMRAEILAATAQSRASSLIIPLLPVIASAFLSFVVPNYFRPMFLNPLGWVMLGIAVGLLVIGNVIIRRITAITCTDLRSPSASSRRRESGCSRRDSLGRVPATPPQWLEHGSLDRRSGS